MKRQREKKFHRSSEKPSWSLRVVIKYSLLQIPAVVLLLLILIFMQRKMDIPLWFIVGLIILWVAKDVILFPFVWRAYDYNYASDTNSMIGKQGITKGCLAPSGYIDVHGELWHAQVVEGGAPIDRGERVQVIGIDRLTLFVQTDNGKDLFTRS
ncbi:MAG: NfeD family protein [Thermodesulfobacteriota bacterium]|nr:NfeD family protein [Thermodesulfobacteriota bacterium]